MEPFAKNTKKKAKKAGVGAGRSSERREKQDAALPMDIPASLQDEEELIGYEPEAPPSFSPIQDDGSAHSNPQRADIRLLSFLLMNYPHFPRRMALR